MSMETCIECGRRFEKNNVDYNLRINKVCSNQCKRNHERESANESARKREEYIAKGGFWGAVKRFFGWCFLIFICIVIYMCLSDDVENDDIGFKGGCEKWQQQNV